MCDDMLFELVNSVEQLMQIAFDSLVEKIARYSLQLHRVVALYLSECCNLLR